MKLAELITVLEEVAPTTLQEDYDNSGLLIGNPEDSVSKALLCLDSTEAVVDEAISKGCDLIIAHHPIVFKGLKRFNNANYVERAVIKAIQNKIAIYACHTNLDNVLRHGVNSKIAQKLGLTDTRILKPMASRLMKLVVFVPEKHSEDVLEALFSAGAGSIGNYSECSFVLAGNGTFNAGFGANPFVGNVGDRHTEAENRVEVVVPEFRVARVLRAMVGVHPYEEVAYDLYALENTWQEAGSGLLGNLPEPVGVDAFLQGLKQKMELPMVKYTETKRGLIQKVAVCGGSGSFLISHAKRAGADVYVTSDIKYHEFFDGEGDMMLCDIGHYESEKYTPELFAEIISTKMPNFALVFSQTLTNPAKYYT